MKKFAILVLIALLTLSIAACTDQQNDKSTSETTSVTTQNDTKQATAPSNSIIAATNSNVSTVTTTASSKSTSVNPDAKFTGKPVPKQQMNNAAKDLKDTMSQIQNTINSLDTASDINTDNIQ